ncbi:MAG TPA: serine/threonine-protein kinase, partial [Thermoanaerobaculia bacterium]
MIGRVVGSYKIVDKVGTGGMGTVFRAVDQMLDREVAIKAIRPELASEAEAVERFRAEAKMLARVNHTAIATIYSFFAEGDELFLAMEFVRGQPLSQVLRDGGAMPWDVALALLAPALAGIEEAHRAGIVHRDLKPDNLMITDGGGIKVMDFGIARMVGGTRLTKTGLLVGTLRYMAPEQIRGEEVDRRTDIYSLGAVLYEMLTGRVPFDGSSDYAVLKAQVEEQPQPPSVEISGLPEWLDTAVLRALAKKPEERFQTVAEMQSFLAHRGGATAELPTARLGIAELPTRDLHAAPEGAATPPPLAKSGPAKAPQATSYRDVVLPRPRSWALVAAATVVVAAGS